MSRAFELITELRTLHLREYEIKKELEQIKADKFIAENTFQNGEVVEVWERTGKNEDRYISDGIIDSGGIFFPLEGNDIKDYAEHESELNEALTQFRYTVKKIKKDGTKSLHNISHSKTIGINPERWSYYIKKKQSV